MSVKNIFTIAGSTAICRSARRIFRVLPRQGSERQNFSGKTVSLAGGHILAASAVIGPVVLPGIRKDQGIACSIASLGAATCGLADDYFADNEGKDKGLKGHLRALKTGRVTTGALKIIGIGVSSLVAAHILHRKDKPSLRRVGEKIVDAAVIAGSANLINLFDLRPGRALKVALFALAPFVGRDSLAQASATSVILLLPGDLQERTMLGDSGANPLGATIGVVIATNTKLPLRLAVAGVIIAATIASEKLSFSAVISNNRVLDAIDSWGRVRK